MLVSHILSAILQADPETLLAAGLSSMLHRTDVLKDLELVEKGDQDVENENDTDLLRSAGARRGFAPQLHQERRPAFTRPATATTGAHHEFQ